VEAADDPSIADRSVDGSRARPSSLRSGTTADELRQEIRGRSERADLRKPLYRFAGPDETFLRHARRMAGAQAGRPAECGENAAPDAVQYHHGQIVLNRTDLPHGSFSSQSAAPVRLWRSTDDGTTGRGVIGRGRVRREGCARLRGNRSMAGPSIETGAARVRPRPLST